MSRTPSSSSGKFHKTALLSSESEACATAPTTADPVLSPSFNWRAHLAVHPTAERFPLMRETDPQGFKELVSDIWKNLRATIIGWASSEGQFLLDGHNRLDALAQLGLLYETSDHHLGIKKWAHMKWTELLAGRIEGSGAWENLYEGNPCAIALSLNVHRRHLDAKGKRAAIDDLLKLAPGKSDRQIAEQVRSSPTTVGKRRRKAESAGDVSKLDTRIDTKGRAQPAKKRKAVVSPVADKALPAPATDPSDIVPNTPGSASPDTSASGAESTADSGEQRKRENAARFDEDLADRAGEDNQPVTHGDDHNDHAGNDNHAGDRFGGGYGRDDDQDTGAASRTTTRAAQCSILQLWESSDPAERALLSDVVLDQYFAASVTGDDILDDILRRIPRDRHREVYGAFLDRLTVDGLLAAMSAELVASCATGCRRRAARAAKTPKQRNRARRPLA
jgi:hypothetical protein